MPSPRVIRFAAVAGLVRSPSGCIRVSDHKTVARDLRHLALTCIHIPRFCALDFRSSLAPTRRVRSRLFFSRPPRSPTCC